jgi:hypothetical protein
MTQSRLFSSRCAKGAVWWPNLFDTSRRPCYYVAALCQERSVVREGIPVSFSYSFDAMQTIVCYDGRAIRFECTPQNN